MFVMVCRIIFVRVRPDDLIVFESVPDAEDSDGSSCEDRHNQHRRSLFSRVKLGWDESSSLFSWADKGQWTTPDTADEEARREGDWFRIGFEPLFVDFTKRGSWFMAYSLAQVRMNATSSGLHNGATRTTEFHYPTQAAVGPDGDILIFNTCVRGSTPHPYPGFDPSCALTPLNNPMTYCTTVVLSIKSHTTVRDMC